MKPVLSVFQWAIKLGYQFLAFFKGFFLIYEIYIWQISHPTLNKRLKERIKSFLKSIPVQTTVSEVLNRVIFFILHFDRQVNGGLQTPPPPLGYVTAWLHLCPKYPTCDQKRSKVTYCAIYVKGMIFLRLHTASKTTS